MRMNISLVIKTDKHARFEIYCLDAKYWIINSFQFSIQIDSHGNSRKLNGKQRDITCFPALST